MAANYATASALATVDDFIDTEVAAILAAVDTEVAAIKAKTDNLPADPADDSDIDTQLAAIAGYLDTEVAAILAAVDTEVAAIKAKTDSLTFTVANQIDANVLDWKSATAPAMTGDAYARIGAAGAGLTALPWNAAWDAEAQSECADALAAYDPPTNAEMEARTLVAANYATAAALATVDDFIDTEVAAILAAVDTEVAAIKAKTDNLPSDPADDSDIDTQLAAIAGYLDTEVAAILAAVDTEVAAIKAKTDNLPADPADDSDIDTQLAAIKAIADKLDTAMELDGAVYRLTENALEQAPTGEGGGLDAAGVRDAIGMADADLDDQLDALAAAIALIDAGSGSGAIAHTVTIEDESAPVSGADVWVTSTNDPDDAVVASGETDGDGQVTFYLDEGTYYVWVQKAGKNFTNPTTIEVSE